MAQSRGAHPSEGGWNTHRREGPRIRIVSRASRRARKRAAPERNEALAGGEWLVGHIAGDAPFSERPEGRRTRSGEVRTRAPCASTFFLRPAPILGFDPTDGPAVDKSRMVDIYLVRAHDLRRLSPRRPALSRPLRRDPSRDPRDVACRRAVCLRITGPSGRGAVAPLLPPSGAEGGRARHRPPGRAMVVLQHHSRGACRSTRSRGCASAVEAAGSRSRVGGEMLRLKDPPKTLFFQ